MSGRRHREVLGEPLDHAEQCGHEMTHASTSIAIADHEPFRDDGGIGERDVVAADRHGVAAAVAPNGVQIAEEHRSVGVILKTVELLLAVEAIRLWRLADDTPDPPGRHGPEPSDRERDAHRAVKWACSRCHSRPEARPPSW